MSEKKGPKILVLDVETSPLTCWTWGTFDQTVGLNQIKNDWHLLSFAAKWLGDPPSKVIYRDQSKVKDVSNDKELLKVVWKLMDEADIILGQNSKKFDVKKLNARFLMHGMPPPSSFRQIDTLQLSKKHFSMTSHKLEYMTSKLCTKYKKLTHKKFPGFSLWSECLKGNQEAWKEMKLYNVHDVLATEELYTKLRAWDSTINFDAYNDELNHTCSCGNKTFTNKGYAYTSTGKFNRYLCKVCFKESRGKTNLLSIEKRKSMRK